jgi:hypothetical protein
MLRLPNDTAIAVVILYILSTGFIARPAFESLNALLMSEKS